MPSGVQLYCVRSAATATAAAQDAGPGVTVLAAACLAVVAYALSRLFRGAPPPMVPKRMLDVVVVAD